MTWFTRLTCEQENSYFVFCRLERWMGVRSLDWALAIIWTWKVTHFIAILGMFPFNCPCRCMGFSLLLLLCSNIHVIAVCLPSQSASRKHSQEKSPQSFAHLVNFYKNMSARLIIIKSRYFDSRINIPFTCSRCVICVSCSVHVILTYYVCKGQFSMRLFNQSRTVLRASV